MKADLDNTEFNFDLLLGMISYWLRHCIFFPDRLIYFYGYFLL